MTCDDDPFCISLFFFSESVVITGTRLFLGERHCLEHFQCKGVWSESGEMSNDTTSELCKRFESMVRRWGHFVINLEQDAPGAAEAVSSYVGSLERLGNALHAKSGDVLSLG